MTVKEYLSNSLKIDDRIQRKKQNLEDLRLLATNISQTISDMPGSGNKNLSKLEDIMIKIADLERELELEILSQTALKIEINILIDRVENDSEQQVLYERYVKNKPFDEIALSMNYHKRHIYRLHDNAIDRLEKKRQEKQDVTLVC